jgi:hypothetical protein
MMLGALKAREAAAIHEGDSRPHDR